MKGGRTGWPPGLLQDDSRRLSKWFASRPDARYIVRKNLYEMHMLTPQSIPVAATDNTIHLCRRSSLQSQGCQCVVCRPHHDRSCEEEAQRE